MRQAAELRLEVINDGGPAIFTAIGEIVLTSRWGKRVSPAAVLPWSGSNSDCASIATGSRRPLHLARVDSCTIPRAFTGSIVEVARLQIWEPAATKPFWEIEYRIGDDDPPWILLSVSITSQPPLKTPCQRLWLIELGVDGAPTISVASGDVFQTKIAEAFRYLEEESSDEGVESSKSRTTQVR
jgi:hypothetical protein